jgi:DNA-directed RNA polymerase subunit RPC12/RpoP
LTAAIAYFIAGISTFALVALLFFNAYVSLSRKREDVRNAEDQVKLLQDCFNKTQNTPEEASAERMLETSIQIYTQIEKRYNETLQKPFYRVPAFMMGFHRAESNWEKKEEKQMTYICEDCGFEFYGAGEICECPYCGKQRIHTATGEEKERLRHLLERTDPGFSGGEERIS